MPLSGKELVKLFKDKGWIIDRIRGSHYIMFNPKTHEAIPIPVHGNHSLGKGLEGKLLKKLKENK